jgi:hypothetical protein
MNILQKLTAVVLVASVAISIEEARRASRLEDELNALNRQKADLAELVQQLTSERDRNASELTTLREERQQERRPDPGQPGRQSVSLDLAQDSVDSTDVAAASWLAKVKQLQQRLNDWPGAKIPELRFLGSFDWVELAHNVKLETDADYRKALGEVRKRAEGYFTKQFQSALKDYMALNNGQWPTDLHQLRTFFNPPVEDAVLERWHIVPKSALPGREFAGEWVLTEKSPVDPAYDHRWTIDGPGSGGVGPYNYIPSETEVEIQTLNDTLKSALDAYAASNNGKEPNNPYALRPYLTTKSQEAALQRIIEFYTTNR